MSRRVRHNDASVSLFPFLAVLICAMGSLIVLLVVVVQQAGQAVAEAPLPPPEEVPRDDQRRSELEQQQEDLKWQAKMLAESREETMRRLREQQTELSMIEDQTRSLKNQLDRLFEESKQLEDQKSREASHSSDVLRRKEALQHEIAAAQLRLEQLQAEAKQCQKRFALVPYEGPNGTTRRPIYVECLADSVIIQPEGIRLGEEDLEPPFDADNVLAVALRAVREYLVNNRLMRTSSEAYPLLVVRPHGEIAYSLCRLALHDWDDDFGYELVDADVLVSYPDPDPNLTSMLQRTVEEARWQQSQKPRQRPREMVLSVTSGQGGFVQEGRMSLRHGNGFGSSAGTSPGHSGPDSGGHPVTDAAGDFRGTHPDRASGKESGTDPGIESGIDPDGDFVAVSPSGPRGRSSGNDSANGSATGRAPYATGSANANRGQQPSANASNGGLASSSNPGSASNANMTRMVAETNPAAAAPLDSIARTQGSNWALPGAAAGAIGIHRPVRIRCDGDRLQLLPEPGTAQPVVTVSTQSGIEAAVRDLVSALWNRIDSWGIAGSGTYWKPVIEAEVTASGERRYLEVSQLMDNSGIVVSRK